MFVGEPLDKGESGCLEMFFSKQLISINCLMAWFVDLKEEGLSLDDVLEACFETFFDPTFAKKSS